jgi:hypothetical protein
MTAVVNRESRIDWPRHDAIIPNPLLASCLGPFAVAMNCKEHHLPELELSTGQVREALQCILHTILLYVLDDERTAATSTAIFSNGILGFISIRRVLDYTNLTVYDHPVRSHRATLNVKAFATLRIRPSLVLMRKWMIPSKRFCGRCHKLDRNYSVVVSPSAFSNDGPVDNCSAWSLTKNGSCKCYFCCC